MKHTHSQRHTENGKTIDVIQFDRFTSATVSDLRQFELDWTKPPDAILLNLQQTGFELHLGVLLADALLDGGTIGQVLTATGNRTYEASRSALFADIPLFVLIDPSTSGICEWVAAALQDQGRATIVGQQSAGQPFVSEPFEVPELNSVMTLTTGLLKRADGRQLVRTTSPGQRVDPVVFTQRKGAPPSAGTLPLHDGGVMPVRMITSNRQEAVQMPFGSGRPFNAGLVTLEDTLAIILPLIPTSAAPAETD